MTKSTGAGVEELNGRRCVAFAGSRLIAQGEIAEVVVAAKAAADEGEREPVLFFDEQTSEPVEIDLRGSDQAIRRRLSGARKPAEPRGPGRPPLGVIAREVTLLPRHWEWLSAQPGGASVTLRRLVEMARRRPDPGALKRQALESAYRFMSAMAGNEAGFEEATRALFRGDRERFENETRSWPGDIRKHVHTLASRVFDAQRWMRTADQVGLQTA